MGFVYKTILQKTDLSDAYCLQKIKTKFLLEESEKRFYASKQFKHVVVADNLRKGAATNLPVQIAEKLIDKGII